MNQPIDFQERQKLRQQLRQERRALSAKQQQRHAKQLKANLLRISKFQRAKRIATYLAGDGEISLQPFIKWCWQHNKQIFLPILRKDKPGFLYFAPYEQGQVLVKNRFNILEPAYEKKNLYLANELDLIVMPLVGFDNKGNRLGMGGGFYDRSLSFLNQQGYFKRPSLIGVGHSLQQVEQLPNQAWDVGLDYIVNEKMSLRLKQQ